MLKAYPSRLENALFSSAKIAYWDRLEDDPVRSYEPAGVLFV